MTGLFAACAVVFLGLTVSMALGWSELRGRAGLARFATARHRSREERLLDVITSAALACCAAAFGARAALEAAGVGLVGLRDGDVTAAIAALAGTLAAVIWTMTVLTSANRRLTLEVSREKDRQMLLNRVLAISAGSRDADEIAAAAADAIGQTNGWSRVTVALPGEDRFFRFPGGASGAAGRRQGLDQGVIGRAYATGLTQLVTDGGRGELAVPLRRNGRTLGVLNLESADAGALGAEEVRLAESLGEAISLGLENARLERARDEITHLMVHDLRSPMVSITGALDLLGAAAGLTPRDQGLLQMARRNAARQNALIDSILEIWELEEGALPERRASVPVETLVADALRLAGPRAEARRLALEADVPGDLPAAWVDPGLIERVLANLVGNAIKFSPEGGTVRVSARAVGTDGIRVSVSDSGPGIEAALLPRLFSKFAPGAHPARGNGLGLAFCRLAVENGGGRIWLEEQEGPGARFVFTIPTEPATADEPAAARLAGRGEWRPSRPRLTGSLRDDLVTSP